VKLPGAAPERPAPPVDAAGRRLRWAWAVVGTVAFLAVGACTGVPDVERDPEPLLQTAELRYDWTRHDVGYATEISFTYRNDTGRRLFLDQCGGDVRPLLQVQRSGRWVDAWHPLVRNCRDEPVVIEAGARWEGSVRVLGAPPGSNVTPNFVFEDVEGVYRLYWFQARLDEPAGADGPQAPVDDRWRVSNPFVISFH